MSSNVLFKRFCVDDESYENNPKEYIKSLLGNEIEIIEIRKNNIIRKDCKVLIDVWFKKLYISPIKTYYITKSDLKRYGDYKDLYIVEIEKNNVLTRLTSQQLNSEKIILNLAPLYNNEIHYFGYFQNEPLHGYSTIIKNNFNYPSVNCVLDEVIEKNNIKELYNEKETIENYKRELLKNVNKDVLGFVSDVELINNFEKTLNSKSTKGFIMSVDILPYENINGHIIIIPKRKTDLIFYYPNVANMIYLDEVKFIKKFINYDKNNLK